MSSSSLVWKVDSFWGLRRLRHQLSVSVVIFESLRWELFWLSKKLEWIILICSKAFKASNYVSSSLCCRVVHYRVHSRPLLFSWLSRAISFCSPHATLLGSTRKCCQTTCCHSMQLSLKRNATPWRKVSTGIRARVELMTLPLSWKFLGCRHVHSRAGGLCSWPLIEWVFFAGLGGGVNNKLTIHRLPLPRYYYWQQVLECCLKRSKFWIKNKSVDVDGRCWIHRNLDVCENWVGSIEDARDIDGLSIGTFT